MNAKFTLLALAGLVAGTGAVWLAWHGGPDRPTEPGPALTLLVGASLLSSGLLSWRARPENRLGPVMVFTGFAWFAGLLTEAATPWLFTIGEAVQFVFIAGFVYLVLSFPSGELQGGLERGLVVAVGALAFPVELAAMLTGDKVGLRCSHCPTNLLQVVGNDPLARHLLDVQRIAGGVATLTTIALLAARWLRASRPQRRAVAPVLWAGSATLAALTVTIVNDETGNPLGALPANVFFYAFATVPVAVLTVFLQRQLARGAVAGLVVRLGRPSAAVDLRTVLSGALRDPSLELAFWFAAEARYVDAVGRKVDLPSPDSDRQCTTIERGGQPIAVLIHDPALRHNADLIQSACAAAGLTLENERLHAELRAQLSELQASRARIVEATDSERRRIERDLHDGTQQRLVSIAMSLGLLESKLPKEPVAAKPIVQETRQALGLALAELRELTQGIHPTILAERGLPAALDELSRRAALPAHLEIVLERRLPVQIESAAYFFVSEALTNATKHSQASGVRVAVSLHERSLTVEVCDDGIGGAVARDGTGLRGLADRVEALGGQFSLCSPPGHGTRLQAEIPCV